MLINEWSSTNKLSAITTSTCPKALANTTVGLSYGAGGRKQLALDANHQQIPPTLHESPCIFSSASVLNSTP